MFLKAVNMIVSLTVTRAAEMNIFHIYKSRHNECISLINMWW